MLERCKDILTPIEAAGILGVGRNSIYELIKNGTISSIRVGRKIIIPKMYLLDFFENNRYKNTIVPNNYDIIHTG